MPEISEQKLLSAAQEFNTARLQAVLEQVLAELTGKSAALLSYDEVREKMGARETSQRSLQEIPVDAIVGSVGRYRDFTRRFLPRLDEDENRWTRVWAHVETMDGLPPIEVFRIGNAYFVRDGNHRVSVARQRGFSHIEAYVTEVAVNVPLTAEDEPEDLIRKARYARFLQRSGLDETIPNLDLSMSVAGNYRELERQIVQHQEWIEAETGETVSYPEAARLWYVEVYWPVIQFVRQRGVLRDFPGRTETDLYVWIVRHQQELAAHLGWSVDPQTAVLDLADKQITAPNQIMRRLSQKLREAIIPSSLEAGPAVGEWRESWRATYREDRLFSHILVAVDGRDAGWHALQQAIRVAWREEGKIFGLHVVDAPEAASSDATLRIKMEFERRCREAGIPGEITITTGPTTGTICYRARWADLVVVSLSHPPGPQPVDRLSSEFGQLLRRCPRPVLAVPRIHAGLDHMLLAYDGSPKAEEALFVAAYLAGQWLAPLTVVMALEKRVTEKTAEQVRAYLADRGIEAHYVVKKSPPASLILNTARQRDCGLILMGGYGLHGVIEIIAGSTVDEVLRSRNRPVLICR